MSENAKIDDNVRRAAQQAGLDRAFKLFPDAVKAAYERGTRPLGAAPEGTPPLLHPAPVFDPVRFEPRK
jgi:hypothetical protein